MGFISQEFTFKINGIKTFIHFFGAQVYRFCRTVTFIFFTWVNVIISVILNKPTLKCTCICLYDSVCKTKTKKNHKMFWKYIFYIVHVKVKVAQSCLTLWHYGLYPWSSPGQNTGVGSHSLCPGIFSNQGSNPGFPHCGWILYQLSHQGSPRILEWVAYVFSSRSSPPRNWSGVSCIAGRFFASWGTRKSQ